MTARVPTALWPVSAALILALDDRLGVPLDSYLNGSQTWHTDSGPRGETLEWRLHPVARYVAPRGLSHYDLWEQVVVHLAGRGDPEGVPLGEESRPLASLWDALECYEAFATDLEPAPLAAAAGAALGIAPDLTGVVDHDRIGDEWERAHGNVSVAALIHEQLGRGAAPDSG